MDKEPGKQSQAFAREQRKWGGAGGWQYPKSGWSCGRGGNVWKGEDWAQGQKAIALHIKTQGSNLQGWWRGLGRADSLSSSARVKEITNSPESSSDLMQTPRCEPIPSHDNYLPLHRKSTAGTCFKMDQMLTEGELGSSALVGELFGGEGSP